MGSYEDGFLPGFTQVNNPNAATYGYADNNEAIIVNHMTVGMGLSPSYAAGHTVPPQLWANPYDGQLIQTGSLRRPGKALYQPQYGNSWTNRHRYCIQIEIVGIPVVNQVTYTDAQNKWLGENVHGPIMKWFRDVGINFDENKVMQVMNSSGSATDTWPGRLSDAGMAAARGMLSHISVWGNDHWDVSVERQDEWSRYGGLWLHGNSIPSNNVPNKDGEMKCSISDNTGSLWLVEGNVATGPYTAYGKDVRDKLAGGDITASGGEYPLKRLGGGDVWVVDRGSLSKAFELRFLKDAT